MFASLASRTLSYRTMASRKKTSSGQHTRASGSRPAQSSNRDSGTLVGSSSKSARRTRQQTRSASLAVSLRSFTVPPSTTAGRRRNSSPPCGIDDPATDPTYRPHEAPQAINQAGRQTPPGSLRPTQIQSSPEGNVDRTKKMSADAKRRHQEHFGPDLYKKCAICLNKPFRQIEHCHVIERGIKPKVSTFIVEKTFH
jgi:hypothetical protein